MELVDDAEEFAHLDRDQELGSEEESGREGDGQEREGEAEDEACQVKRKVPSFSLTLNI